MKKSALTYLKHLISPLAVGLYLSLATVLLTIQFYENYADMDQKVKQHPILGLFWMAHQKSLDYRMQARGLRPGSDDVVLLAIDERAVNEVGRWPWPREVIAHGIEKAIQSGAKVIGFDAVFSEPSSKPAEDLLNRIMSSRDLPQDIEKAFNEELKSFDSDRIFAEVIARNADHIVTGAFFENETPVFNELSYQNQCVDLIQSLDAREEEWKKQSEFFEVRGMPFSTNEISFPETLKSVYIEQLKAIDAGIREKNALPRTFRDEVALRGIILRDQEAFCVNFLDPAHDEFYNALNEETWKQLQAERPDIKPYSSFKDWSEKIKSNSLIDGIPAGMGWVLNTADLNAGAKYVGYFNADLDSDGTIRKKRLIIRSGTNYKPSLSLMTYLIAKNYKAIVTMIPDPKDPKRTIVNEFKIVDKNTNQTVGTIPTDHHGRLIINYAGPQMMFAHASMSDMFSDNAEMEITKRVKDASGKWEKLPIKVNKKDYLKNKILVLGATAIGIYDLRVTPFESNMPGPETHLNVIDNLLRRDFLRTIPDEPRWMIITLIGIGLILSYALAHMGAVTGLLLTAGVLGSVIAFDRFYLFQQGIVVTIVLPLFLIFVLFLVMTFYKYFSEERGKKELRTTFQKYVSPAIVEEILSDPTNIQLGGRKAHVTIFFSDVRGFTTISEKLDPQALSDLLNSYLTPMTDLVFKNRGTLDKYMGDAIMAFFGAPIGYKDHAKWACRCALQHLVKLKELQAEYERKGLPQIDIGIGLNTGDVSVGNMGSETVRSYTVMGDAVNLASRLEGITKQYGVRVIISEFTYQEVKDSFICREVDWVRVKGKVLPVKIYELIAEQKVPSTTEEVIKWFQEGYNHYHNKNWEGALENFNKAIGIDPNDSVTKLYIERCEDYRMTPPPEDWDGVFVMKTK